MTKIQKRKSDKKRQSDKKEKKKKRKSDKMAKSCNVLQTDRLADKGIKVFQEVLKDLKNF